MKAAGEMNLAGQGARSAPHQIITYRRRPDCVQRKRQSPVRLQSTEPPPARLRYASANINDVHIRQTVGNARLSADTHLRQVFQVLGRVRRELGVNFGGVNIAVATNQMSEYRRVVSGSHSHLEDRGAFMQSKRIDPARVCAGLTELISRAASRATSVS